MLKTIACSVIRTLRVHVGSSGQKITNHKTKFRTQPLRQAKDLYLNHYADTTLMNLARFNGNGSMFISCQTSFLCNICILIIAFFRSFQI